MAKLTPLLTSLKTLNIMYKAAQETLLSTPETLPTTEPTTPQISYTVAEADLPTFNITPYKKVWVAYLVAAGKCPTAATIYWRMLKNGTNVATGSGSVGAGYYYTRMFWFYDIKVGDVLDIKLWSSVTDSNWDYKAYQIQVTRIIPMNKPRLLSPCNFTLSIVPTLSLGNPSVLSTGSLYPYHDDKAAATQATSFSYAYLYPKDTYGLFRISCGDYNYSNSSNVGTHLSYRPYYFRNYVPTQIKMRGLRIG